MSMKRKYIKWRRTRAIDKNIVVSQRLNELRIARSGLDGSVWPGVARELDLDIAAAERRVVKYCNYLKNTEAL